MEEEKGINNKGTLNNFYNNRFKLYESDDNNTEYSAGLNSISLNRKFDCKIIYIYKMVII